MAKFREARKAVGLTLSDVASAIGMSESQVSRIERGERTAHLDEAIAMAKLYGISLSELVGEPVSDAHSRRLLEGMRGFLTANRLALDEIEEALRVIAVSAEEASTDPSPDAGCKQARDLAQALTRVSQKIKSLKSES